MLGKIDFINTTPLGTNVNIAGIVLAGGQSSRMGQDKAKLTIEDHTLLSRAVNLLQIAGFEDCYVSGDYQGFNCIVDTQSELGPIAGIAACATQLSEQKQGGASVDHSLHSRSEHSSQEYCNTQQSKKYDALFIMPVDMPLLAVEDCKKLLQHFIKQFTNQSITGKQGVYYKETTFPMLLSLNDTLLTYLDQALSAVDKKQRSLYRLIETLNIEAISQQQVDLFRFENTNTPEQWQRCLATYSKMQTDKFK
ncbi:molybdenum cofactor guanylyltransferase [Psychromonas sp. SR45-3]|uniref:molybdenum cofactor guanylyltransferase n=1 Tax=Psychromonas sp. SR45-3 TaxID=2760930 RepID=UPI002175D31E|nr:molybdenum cofactor guanylyltransferase [Psychromonas sp. SR45-3]